ncbi:polysaccharide biosynthesis protein [Candidatus Nitrosopelagicus sp.]|nr:polysaccharide biosynthesis protein [Candidatus Nitrosopelagicus sp.]
MYKNKKILITGGTGSLGTALTKRLLSMDVEQIRIFSRNEFKQISMESEIYDDRLRFLIGDVRDQKRLRRAIEDVDIVFHAAALKHVPKIEYNPFEAIKTNVEGSQNVIDACLENDIERAVCIGTDKAVSPLNTYGATKLLMEKLFINAQQYSNPKKHPTKFFAVRYGNVFGSSGSVIPKFIDQIKNNQSLTITDEKMTRFSITMQQALDFILKATELGNGTEIFIPRLKSYNLEQVKNTLFDLCGTSDSKIIGIRPGEKLHETLINFDEMRSAWIYNDLYVILNEGFSSEYLQNTYPGLTKLENISTYSSDNSEKMSNDELKQTILDSNLIKK